MPGGLGGSRLGRAGLVEPYLAEIAARLPGPASTRSCIVAELRSGLLDAMDVYRSTGLAPAEAAEAAIREFGDPGQIANEFLPEIAASQARRVAAVLLVTGPLTGLLWLATAAVSHPAVRVTLPWHWTTLPTAMGAGICLVAAAVAVTAGAGAVSIAVTGRLSRWIPAVPRHAPLTAAITGFGAIGADGLGLILLAAELAAVPGTPFLIPTAAAAVTSLARLIVAGHAAQRCLTLRSSLTKRQEARSNRAALCRRPMAEDRDQHGGVGRVQAGDRVPARSRLVAGVGGAVYDHRVVPRGDVVESPAVQGAPGDLVKGPG